MNRCDIPVPIALYNLPCFYNTVQRVAGSPRPSPTRLRDDQFPQQHSGRSDFEELGISSLLASLEITFEKPSYVIGIMQVASILMRISRAKDKEFPKSDNTRCRSRTMDYAKKNCVVSPR